MFATAIQTTLNEQTPNEPEEVETLTINMIGFQKIRVELKLSLQSYSTLKYLEITKCDLRNLNNFPNLLALQQLRISNNGLQGGFENIMKLKKLQYLDISHNLISDMTKLIPLRRIKKLQVFTKFNPFETKEGYKQMSSIINLILLNEPRKHPIQPKEIVSPFLLKKQESNASHPNGMKYRNKLDLFKLQNNLHRNLQDATRANKRDDELKMAERFSRNAQEREDLMSKIEERERWQAERQLLRDIHRDHRNQRHRVGRIRLLNDVARDAHRRIFFSPSERRSSDMLSRNNSIEIRDKSGLDHEGRLLLKLENEEFESASLQDSVKEELANMRDRDNQEDLNSFAIPSQEDEESNVEQAHNLGHIQASSPSEEQDEEIGNPFGLMNNLFRENEEELDDQEEEEEEANNEGYEEDDGNPFGDGRNNNQQNGWY